MAFRDSRSDGRGNRDFGRSGGGFGRSGGGFNRGGFGRDRRPLEMHDAVCAKCKKECRVPFKPTGDKPVYCSDCFEKNGNSGRSSSSGMSSEQFDKINGKLDMIIKALKITPVTAESEAEEDLELEEEDETAEEEK